MRDVYELGDQILIVTTDRLSAFDRFVTTIPFKGQILNQTAAWWFHKTACHIPNSVLAVPDPNVVIMKRVNVFPIEFIVRGYMTGMLLLLLFSNAVSRNHKYVFMDALQSWKTTILRTHISRRNVQKRSFGASHCDTDHKI